jgi:hypothetical protein
MVITMGIVVFCAIMIPFLYIEIRKGKAELGPQLKETDAGGVRFGATTPTGTGDQHVGSRRDPAFGQPDGQPDPYSAEARRNAPPVRS